MDAGEKVPLPGFGNSDSAERAVVHRNGIRHARRMSNWTAAALIVGTGAAAVALAHQASPAAAPAVGTAGSLAGAPQVTHSVATTSASGVTTQGASAPRVTHSVATTSASGVTTTTRTVNGKTIVTRVQTHGDD